LWGESEYPSLGTLSMGVAHAYLNLGGFGLHIFPCQSFWDVPRYGMIDAIRYQWMLNEREFEKF